MKRKIKLMAFPGWVAVKEARPSQQPARTQDMKRGGYAESAPLMTVGMVLCSNRVWGAGPAVLPLPLWLWAREPRRARIQGGRRHHPHKPDRRQLVRGHEKRQGWLLPRQLRGGPGPSASVKNRIRIPSTSEGWSGFLLKNMNVFAKPLEKPRHWEASSLGGSRTRWALWSHIPDEDRFQGMKFCSDDAVVTTSPLTLDRVYGCLPFWILYHDWTDSTQKYQVISNVSQQPVFVFMVFRSSLHILSVSLTQILIF